MATGPEHYTEAERLLADIDRLSKQGTTTVHALTVICGAAQVHATLALAAATGLNDADAGMPVTDSFEWASVAGRAAKDAR